MYATLVVGDVEYTADPESEPQPAVAEASGTTLRVPEDHDTIEAAVDAAEPGDLVLIGPGVYREEVKVDTPSLVLRATDRNEVVIDGEFTRPNAVSITAAGTVDTTIERNRIASNALHGVLVTPNLSDHLCRVGHRGARQRGQRVGMRRPGAVGTSR